MSYQMFLCWGGLGLFLFGMNMMGTVWRGLPA